MILPDVLLREYLDSRLLVVDPLAETAVQPNSIDVRLGPELLVGTPDGWREHHLIDNGPLRLHQGAFILGSTLEWVELPNTMTAVLAGKSSTARRGIQVESAGLVDAGWKGQLTLEIVMLAPVPDFLTVGMPIGQLYVHMLLTACERPYGSPGLNSRYQHSHGPVPARNGVTA